MKGLYGLNKKMKGFKYNSLEFSFDLNSNDKFNQDKIFYENSQYVIGLDGVILNKKIFAKSKEEWINFFLENIQKLPHQLNLLRGSFHGFIYDKLKKELIIFNDPTGSKNFYYLKNNNEFTFHYSDIELIQLLKKNTPLEISEESVYSFLAYGFLPSGWSWIKKCKRLRPGSILKFYNNNINEIQYKKFISAPKEFINKNAALETFEYLFKNAVSLQYEKDYENGYKHFATLSGGLDSRSTILMAYDLGYQKQTTFTCSQSGYADEKIAYEIAENYKFDHFFQPLDNFEHLFKIPNYLKKIGGSTIYSGPSHVIYGIENFWNSDFGIIHTGHIGDGVMGGFLTLPKFTKPNLNFGRVNSSLFPHHFDFDKLIISRYTSEEEYKLYERGFSHAASGVWGLEHLSYNISPFTDIDMIDFLLKLPYSIKYRRKIYIEWLNTFHPDWTRYPVESIRSKPNRYWKFKHQKSYLRLRFGLRKLISREYRLKWSMTPEQYWYENSEELQNYYSKEFDNAIEIAKDKHLPFTKEIQFFHQSKDFISHAKSLHLTYMINLIYS